MGSMHQEVPAVLRARDVHYHYGSQPILTGLSLKVAPGEVLCLLGHNGVGKTTAINHFLGFLRPASGQVEVMGRDPAKEPQVVRDQVGYVPENAALYGHLNAIENFDYFFAVAGLPCLGGEQARAYLQQVGFPLERSVQPAAGYSEGMRQKVVLALALAKKARILLLDEPTTGLDPQSAHELTERILESRTRGVGVLVVTHDLPWAQRTADLLGIMEGGRIRELLRCGELGPAELAERLLGNSLPAASAAR
jgi:ABC-2 type transport system ATP-binding protein